MSIHLTDEEIKNYHEHKLSPQILLRADFHLAECDDCQNRVSQSHAFSPQDIARNLHQDLSKTAKLEEDHVPYEQLELLVDGKLDPVDLEIVQSHLEVCLQCRNEAADLRNFREKLNRPEIQDSGRVISWRGGLMATVLRIAGVAAMIALFVWAATLPMRDRIKKLQAELDQAKKDTARLTLENSRLQRQSDELQTRIAQLKHSESQLPIIASLNDRGRVLTVDQHGNIAGISSVSPLYAKITKDAFTRQSIETPAFLAGLIGKRSPLLGPSESGQPFDLAAPVGTVVLEDRPNFRWKPMKGAKGYRVRVFDPNFAEIAETEVLKDTNWKPRNAFERGRTYIWLVTAYLPDKEISSPVPPAPEARFMVLHSDQYEQLQQAKKDLEQSHLLSGLVYARYGLLDDSMREFNQLLSENPDSEVAKKLLDRIRSLRKNNP